MGSVRILFVTEENGICSLNGGYIFLKNNRKIDTRLLKGVVSFVSPKVILRAGIPCIHVCRDLIVPYNLRINYLLLDDIERHIGRIAHENLQISRKTLAKNSRFVWVKNWEHLIAILRFPRMLELTAGAVAMLLALKGTFAVNPFSVVRIGKSSLFVWEIIFAPLLSAVIGRELGSILTSDHRLSNDPRECANIIMNYMVSSRTFLGWHERCLSLLFRKGIYKPYPSESHRCFTTYSREF